ncbi:MAG: hypothetical protein K9N09_11560 [Candidatus Cloacimonetes bacterium]|nr:hypothetical protein [Candidatus Cloacimonadota bacterium]MCF7815097.1 hypothetical protein [Candidatus Cloacimonadota bacterium]MCF7869321.1 hypothetical protein [Candidatus Cloacimonadota bacterium]MCF7884727.1 hypothetical protein [Candidatus Cloacimonadota bacterium]
MKNIIVVLVLIVASQVLVAEGQVDYSEQQGAMVCEYVPSPFISRIFKPSEPPMILVCEYEKPIKMDYPKPDLDFPQEEVKIYKPDDKYPSNDVFEQEPPSIGPVKDFFEARERLERDR